MGFDDEDDDAIINETNMHNFRFHLCVSFFLFSHQFVDYRLHILGSPQVSAAIYDIWYRISWMNNNNYYSKKKTSNGEKREEK